MNSYVQMTCYDHGGVEEDDSSILTASVPTAETANFISPTVHIRTFPVAEGGGTGSGVLSCWARIRNGWRSHTALERSLLLVTCGLVMMMALILPVLLSAYVNLKSKQDLRLLHISHRSGTSNSLDDRCGLCTSAACVSASALMMSAMDTSVDPCQDFFQYACGRWIRTNPIPSGKPIWGTFDRLWQDNQIVMKTILEQPAESLVSEAEKRAQRYYQSCLDINETMEALGSKPILELLTQIGGWSAIEPRNSEAEKRWVFQEALQTAHNVMNMGGFFTWAVAEDDKNSSRHIIQMDQSGLTLPNRDYYINKTENDEILVAYLDYMTKVGVLLSSSVDPQQIRTEMKDIIELETRIAQITVASAERRDEEKLYHALTVADLQNLAPFLDWNAYFQSAFFQVNISITPSHPVVVFSPDFLHNLSVVIEDLVVTDKGKRMLHNYMGWHVVRSYLSYLPKAFRDAGKILRKLLMGSDGNEETWRSCVTDTNSVLGFAVGAMFVKQNFHGESKPLAENMIAAVKEAFKNNFDNLDWMDEETRLAARDKADAITDMIGYPKFILNPQELDELYGDLKIESNEYFLNNVRSNQFALRQNLIKLNEPVNKTLWGMTPSMVNAYYTPNKNQIVFPAGILQQPFFDNSFPYALNFGAMGVVMGHELTHAFDDQGREFDRNGDLAPWWNNATIERFQKRTECLVQQYSSYTINGQPLNGKQTLGENIADNGGLKAAYHAFDNWAGSSDDELVLPGLNLTRNQLFFLAFAQVWCSSSTKEALHLQILNDPHSPARYRVIGPVSNMPEFASVFECQSGTPMNPKNKCEIW
ncbi:Endothelin-converting enzyme 1 [Daphnia magna]|uniref:Endothelin-converting enzyme 1 n=1 Tax=Daphnia magna TaxID=35525 RepID=A0A0N8A3P6_9CRUS|nr:Endothelin-converting enzyme 1 [Daphnia magna]